MTSNIYTPRGASLEERLKIRSQPNLDTGCRDFIGMRNASGYGSLKVGKGTMLAHRASYIAHIGPIPNNAQVLHTCDRRRCIEPTHLFLGDNAANVADRVKKGRSARGERIGILVSNDIHAIRADPRTGREIAADYGVSDQTIYDIKNRKRWTHV